VDANGVDDESAGARTVSGICQERAVCGSAVSVSGDRGQMAIASDAAG
jgi:hypothetical protein